jgi:hypothetical protein
MLKVWQVLRIVVHHFREFGLCSLINEKKKAAVDAQANSRKSGWFGGLCKNAKGLNLAEL